MTREQFREVMAYLSAGIGKTLETDSVRVYFDCLGDLPFDALMLAAKRVLMEHRWATFPSIAELREAASESIRGVVKDVSPAEAWAMAWNVAGSFDPDVHGEYVVNGKSYGSQMHYLTHNLPPVVVKAIDAFGVLSLCATSEPVGVLRGQFMKTFEQIAARVKREALMPASLTRAIKKPPATALPAPVALALAGVGRPVKTAPTEHQPQ
jgi:hypothetical protein